ncbi:MAG: DUF4296 domain-containing protein [Psychroserpens sp.]|uniref:DUF4296 domain-containing protein n=1 Tax=Psychroserpens sp. TaxID=2020870 RepID=UPI0030023F7B
MRIFVILFVVLSCIGCNSFDKLEKPDNLIPKDKMEDIIYDVFILNAAKGSSKGVLENNGILPEDYVFEKYKIDSLQFVKSNEYYGFHVEEYQSILANVEERINNDKEKYQKRIDDEKNRKQEKRDSIKKLSDKYKNKKKDTTTIIKKLEYKDYPDDSK